MDFDELDEYLNNIKREEIEKEERIKEYSDNPSKIKEALEKVLKGKLEISSDSFSDEELPLTKEEFSTVYAT